MKSKQPVAVLIHGHHLQAPEWEKLVWGTHNLEQVGRIPRGIEIAIKEKAKLIIWGTGASEDIPSGKKESEYTNLFAITHAEELAAYVGSSKKEIIDLITQYSDVQLGTKNTKDEIREALALCKEKGIHTLYLVSSPTHISRCLLTAIQLQDEYTPVLYGVPAETYTELWNPKDVAIVEPAHRPDRAEVPMNLLAKRMASVRKYKHRAPELYEDVKQLLDSFDEMTVEEQSKS